MDTDTCIWEPTLTFSISSISTSLSNPVFTSSENFKVFKPVIRWVVLLIDLWLSSFLQFQSNAHSWGKNIWNKLRMQMHMLTICVFPTTTNRDSGLCCFTRKWLTLLPSLPPIPFHLIVLLDWKLARHFCHMVAPSLKT